MTRAIFPPVIGHRGAAAYAPENTLASFRKAADLGCRMVEFDVRLSADGVPVVFHDARLERTTDGAGWVGETSLAQLKRLDAGRWFAPAFAGESIPTLAEAMDVCRDLGLAVNIEIKPDHGAERATAVAALETAGRIWPSDRPPPLVSSFRRPALATAAAVAPAWPRALLVGRLGAGWRRAAKRLGCVSVNADHRYLSRRAVAAIGAAGLAVMAYTVNDSEAARTLWEAGVASCFSDAPDRLGTGSERGGQTG
ncbi:MAG: glycerophosphodiester phosphodiesterase [Magnetospirillum sp.]|nr:glycerophosphodiester phosphodiesterase [Magnetospirillum sp.]